MIVDLLCAASSPDLYRINLEQGRFLPSVSTHSPALNVISRSRVHGLVACGGEDGAVECFDMRTKSSAGLMLLHLLVTLIRKLLHWHFLEMGASSWLLEVVLERF